MTADEAQRTTLEKVRVLQRKLYRAAKAQPQRTFGVLFDKVCSLEVLWFAWAQVRRNRGAAGVDGETIESIEARGTLWFLLELREELMQQRYRPQPVRRVFIPKPDGRQRPLGIPGVARGNCSDSANAIRSRFRRSTGRIAMRACAAR